MRAGEKGVQIQDQRHCHGQILHREYFFHRTYGGGKILSGIAGASHGRGERGEADSVRADRAGGGARGGDGGKSENAGEAGLYLLKGKAVHVL